MSVTSASWTVAPDTAYRAWRAWVAWPGSSRREGVASVWSSVLLKADAPSCLYFRPSPAGGGGGSFQGRHGVCAATRCSLAAGGSTGRRASAGSWRLSPPSLAESRRAPLSPAGQWSVLSDLESCSGFFLGWHLPAFSHWGTQ